MALSEILGSIATAEAVAVDTETCDPNLRDRGPGFVRGDAFVAGVSMAWRPAGGDLMSAYLPVAHETGPNLDAQDALSSFFRAWDRPVVMANASYDLDGLRAYGVEFSRARIEDVQIREALIDETRRSYALNTLAKRHLGEEKLGDALKQKAMHNFGVREKDAMSHIWRLGGDDVAAYARMDAELTLRIYEKQVGILSHMDLQPVLDLESELTKVLLAMRWRGVRFDVQGAEALVAQMQREAAQFRTELGDDPQIWANDWVAKEAARRGLSGVKTPTGQSFTGPWMERQDHAFWAALLKARQFDKACTFVSSLIESSSRGRIHCQYHQTRDPERGGTRSGRLSASNPNLQQVPGRNEGLAKPIRRLFLPEVGEVWWTNDYSQAEPRITVHYAHKMGLPGAAEARRRYIEDPSTDYHQMVADMTGLARRPAKNLNLGLTYGMGQQKLADSLGVSKDEAAGILAQYHAGVPFVRGLSEKCRSVASSRGYVKTVLGRRRHFHLWGPRRWAPGILPKPYDEAVAEFGPGVQRYFLHKALNAVIQGTAADITKKAMVDLHRAGMVPLLTLHDDLPMSFPQGADRSAEVKEIMETCLILTVPHLVEPSCGPTWGDA